MFEEDEEEDTGLPGTFATYLAEGESLYRNGNFKKALTSYDLALELSPGNLIGLISRSKCYLALGDSAKALKDAEASLKDDQKNHRGIYAKAEALYQQGDFEFALVYFHRGQNIRPELQEFRLGIQKSQEAIDNCVGKPSSCKLQAKGDLSFFDKAEEGKGKSGGVRNHHNCPNKPSVKGRTVQTHQAKGKGGKAAKVVLGELYKDKEYLEKLIGDEDLVKGSAAGVNIYDLVLSGIQYLDTRTDFWRQQRPLYARNRDRLEMKRKWSSRPDKEPEPTAFILKNLEKIDAYLADGKAADSLDLANETLDQVEGMTFEVLPNKDDVLANLQSCIGNAYLELGDYELALHHHQEDLEISKDLQFLDAKSRALDNLGRVHARAGDFQNAINCWEEKLPLSRSALESTWLYHEIGRCYLELSDCEKAMENGELSLEEAKKANDQVWQLNASVLIAQAQVQVKDYANSIESFRHALAMAKKLNDHAAETAVTKALEDVNIKRSKQFRQMDVEERERQAANSQKSNESIVSEEEDDDDV